MKRKPFTLDAMPVSQETLKAAQFLRLVNENPALIKSSRVVAPKLGERGFGKVMVEYSRPVLHAR